MVLMSLWEEWFLKTSFFPLVVLWLFCILELSSPPSPKVETIVTESKNLIFENAVRYIFQKSWILEDEDFKY